MPKTKKKTTPKKATRRTVQGTSEPPAPSAAKASANPSAQEIESLNFEAVANEDAQDREAKTVIEEGHTNDQGSVAAPKADDVGADAEKPKDPPANDVGVQAEPPSEVAQDAVEAQAAVEAPDASDPESSDPESSESESSSSVESSEEDSDKSSVVELTDEEEEFVGLEGDSDTSSSASESESESDSDSESTVQPKRRSKRSKQSKQSKKPSSSKSKKPSSSQSKKPSPSEAEPKKKDKVYKPAKPIMGELVQTGPKTFEAVVGGKPKHDWSGLAKKPALIKSNPYLTRSTSSKPAAAFVEARHKGIEPKLGPTTPWGTFATKLIDHAKTHGMDTVMYRADPGKKKRMINVAKHPSKFPTMESVHKATAKIEDEWDPYDEGNNFDLKRCIYNSLSKDLYQRLRLQQKKGETAADLLVRLSHMHRKRDSAAQEANKALFRSLHPDDFPLQDITKLSQKALEIAEELENDDAYVPSLTLSYIRTVLLAGGSSSVDNPGRDRFVRHLWPTEEKLEKLLERVSTTSLSPRAQAAIFAKNKLTLKEVCTKCDNIYLQLRREGLWYPARQPQDSRAPPCNFGANVVSLNGSPNGNGAGSNCYTCGQPGHISRNCPNNGDQGDSVGGGSSFGNSNRCQDNSQGSGQGNRGNQGRQGSRNGRNQGRGRQGRQNQQRPPREERSWNRAPPQPGQPERRMYKGKAYSWCAHCQRWTTSHGTATHNDSRTTRPAPQAQANVGLSYDVDAWFPASPHAHFASFVYPEPDEDPIEAPQAPAPSAPPSAPPADSLSSLLGATLKTVFKDITVSFWLLLLVLSTLENLPRLMDLYASVSLASILAQASTCLTGVATLALQARSVAFDVGSLAVQGALLLAKHWLCTAPGMLWLFLLAASVFAGKYRAPRPSVRPVEQPKLPRAPARRLKRLLRRKFRSVKSPGGASAYGYHRSLPLRLRQQEAYRYLPDVRAFRDAQVAAQFG